MEEKKLLMQLQIIKKLDYAQPFQQGFGGSFELATKISKHTPGNLNRIFYTICGSTAVETAIKIAVAYHKARGEGHRFRFVGRERGYQWNEYRSYFCWRND